MKTSTVFATVTILALAGTTPLFAMGGGGGGMGGGGYGGMGMGGMQMDDYGTAVRLIHREKYADAIPYLDRALNDRPHSADVLNYEGYTHRMVGDYSASLAYYQKALAIDPDHKGAHEYLGELYLMMHDTASANGQLAELTRLCPDGCDEKDVLTKSIADYQARTQAAGSPAPATTQQ